MSFSRLCLICLFTFKKYSTENTLTKTQQLYEEKLNCFHTNYPEMDYHSVLFYLHFHLGRCRCNSKAIDHKILVYVPVCCFVCVRGTYIRFYFVGPCTLHISVTQLFPDATNAQCKSRGKLSIFTYLRCVVYITVSIQYEQCLFTDLQKCNSQLCICLSQQELITRNKAKS